MSFWCVSGIGVLENIQRILSEGVWMEHRILAVPVGECEQILRWNFRVSMRGSKEVKTALFLSTKGLSDFHNLSQFFILIDL